MTNGTVAGQTKYAKLYTGTYWGNFNYEINKAGMPDEIFVNRNKLPLYYKIKGIDSRKRTDEIRQHLHALYGMMSIDHWEAYKTEGNGCLLIISLYQGQPPPDFKETHPLYGSNTTTYKFHLLDTKELSDYLTELKRRRIVEYNDKNTNGYGVID